MGRVGLAGGNNLPKKVRVGASDRDTRDDEGDVKAESVLDIVPAESTGDDDSAVRITSLTKDEL
jgi:hypothetical protein